MGFSTRPWVLCGAMGPRTGGINGWDPWGARTVESAPKYCLQLELAFFCWEKGRGRLYVCLAWFLIRCVISPERLEKVICSVGVEWVGVMLPLLPPFRPCNGKACAFQESGVWGVLRSSGPNAARRSENVEFWSLPLTLRPIRGGQVGEKGTKTQHTHPVEVVVDKEWRGAILR